MATRKSNKAAKKRGPKNKGGRPTKYKATYCGQVYKLCLLGATDQDIADFFEVNVDTVQEWKKVYARFSDSIKRGKKIADMIVADSLFQRSKGAMIKKQAAYKLKTVKYEGTKRIETEEIKIVDLKEQVPPDTTAGIFWLKNRHPEKWRDAQKMELTGKDGKDLIPARTLTKEEAREFLNKLESEC